MRNIVTLYGMKFSLKEIEHLGTTDFYKDFVKETSPYSYTPIPVFLKWVTMPRIARYIK